MNRVELVEKIAANSGLTKSDADKALDGFITAVKDGLVAGDKITLVGFGTFSVSERKARTGHNPKTGESVQIAASKAAKFKPGKVLKEILN